MLSKFFTNLARRVGQHRAARLEQKFLGLDRRRVFEKIYADNAWGKRKEQSYFSGPGSHDPKLVTPYVKSVSRFLIELGGKASVVDLGCGDFNIGSQIRPFCGGYIACDIVASVISDNQNRFRAANVDFRCLDMCEGPLPVGDVVFLREVLQHLSNESISKVLARISETYKYLILTEDLPLEDGFVANQDKHTGPSTRSQFGGGVVLEAAPFNFPFQTRRKICEIRREGSRLQTLVYSLQ